MRIRDSNQINETKLDPQILRILRDAENIAAYRLPDDALQIFKKFESYFVADPLPEFIIRWMSEKRLKRWYLKLIYGIEETQDTLTCAYYHRNNMLDIEGRVLKELSQYNFSDIIENDFFIGGGNTLKLDFEYQAFTLSIRRCLDYLARALAAFFQKDFHSFRKVSPKFGSFEPKEVAKMLIETHAEYAHRFSYVLSEGDRKSIRDKISHYGYVPAGTLNISSKGFIFAGDGEAMRGTWEQSVLISTLINRRLEDLQECVDAFLNNFVEAVASYYATKNG
jgi:hypothetical protein